MGEDDLRWVSPVLFVKGNAVSYTDKPLKIDEASAIRVDGGWNKGADPNKGFSTTVELKIRTCEVVDFLWGICKEEARSAGRQLAEWIRCHPFDPRKPRKQKKEWKKKIAEALYDNYAILTGRRKHLLKYIKGKRK